MIRFGIKIPAAPATERLFCFPGPFPVPPGCGGEPSLKNLLRKQAAVVREIVALIIWRRRDERIPVAVKDKINCVMEGTVQAFGRLALEAAHRGGALYGRGCRRAGGGKR